MHTHTHEHIHKHTSLNKLVITSQLYILYLMDKAYIKLFNIKVIM